MNTINNNLMLLVIFLTASLTIVSGCTKSNQGKQDSRTIVLGHAMHVTHPVAIAMDFMSQQVKELSDGQLTVKIYPAGQLGGERELLELVQIGTIGITKISGASLENIVPAVRVFSLPYLFRNSEHMWKVLSGNIGQEILDEGARYQLKGLNYYDAGMRSFYTIDRPILSPEDLAGMKIRVQPSIMAIQLIRSYGGSPTPLAYGELYTAFQGGIVDGAENNPPSYYSSRHYEVTNYYVLNEHTAVPDFLVVGTRLWESLNEQEQEWLQQAVDESVEYQRELWNESEEESLKIVEEAGVEVIYPDKTPFKNSVQHLYDRIQQNDPELYEWVERIQNIE